MSGDESQALGERVTHLRRRLGLSQVELAARLGRSESWLSQVERGVRSVDRVSVLTKLAAALDVPVAALAPGSAPAGAPETAPVPYLDDLRLLLSGRPALGVAFGVEDGTPVLAEDARRLAAECWTLAHESRYQELGAKLGKAIPSLEAGVLATSGARRRVAQEALVDVYLATSAMLAKLDEVEGAWLAADRAGALAEGVGGPALVAATQYRLAIAFISTRRSDQARHVADRAIAALKPLIDDAPVELLSVWGALHLVLAIACARDGERQASRRYLARARAASERVGEGRNDFETEFSPANVEVHAVAAAIELGDAGEALERAAVIDAAGLSPERRARMLIDVARAYDQLRRPADALHALAEAESLSPEQVQDHALVRDTVRSLLQQAGRRPSSELRSFAQRIGASE